MLKISTISIFPEIFRCLDYGIPGRAQKTNVSMQHINLADYSERKDRRVDDRPFGGGPGMVMKPDIMLKAIQAVSSPPPLIIVPDPTGKAFTQKDAQRLSIQEHLLFVCGRYEGIDARLLHHIDHERFSCFDAVISGGELPSALMIDAIIREVDSVLGNAASLAEDSFQKNRLDHPHFTRPWDWQSVTPPDILKSGHHSNMMRWRNQQTLGITWMHRPDLLLGQKLSPEDIEDLMIFLTQQELAHERDP